VDDVVRNSDELGFSWGMKKSRVFSGFSAPREATNVAQHQQTTGFDKKHDWSLYKHMSKLVQSASDIFKYNQQNIFCLPSGKRLHNYRKSQFSMGKSTINRHFQ